jgi:hypothetical protein
VEATTIVYSLKRKPDETKKTMQEPLRIQPAD